MFKKFAFGLACVALCGSSVAFGQDDLLRQLYGRGVHAFNDGDMNTAVRFLTLAIEQGSDDPRVFYFRGLAFERAGRPDESKDDFQKGAELELSSSEGHLINRALERIQGQTRLTLEAKRSEVKLLARLERVQREKELYEAAGRDEKSMVRPEGGGAAQAAGIPDVPASAPNEPFPSDSGTPAPADPPAAGGVDALFGGGDTPPPANPAGDAFGLGDPADGGQPAPVDGGDPFGDENAVPMNGGGGAAPGGAAPAGGDPFGLGGGGAAPGGEAPAAGGDPFGLGGGGAAPGGAAPAGGAPPAGGDPFGLGGGGAAPGGAAPAGGAPPAAGDPFGLDAGGGGAAPGAAPAADPFGAPAGGAMPADGGGGAMQNNGGGNDDVFADPFAN